MQSSWYWDPISWCVCHAKSISNVGTSMIPGCVAIKSKNLRITLVRHAIFAEQRRPFSPMISRKTVHQHRFILWVIEESGLGPVEVIHLVDEGTLTKDGAGKVEGEGPVTRISGQHALESGV